MNLFSMQSSNRIDNADKKRVELHLHTKMSKMDALISPEEAIKTAKKWGHSAIAITDHGNVQAFPEAMLAAEKYDIKVIYGLEAYSVNDLDVEDKELKLSKLWRYHQTILVKNQVGLKNLYRLISESNLQHCYRGFSCIPKSQLKKYREGLLIGSACNVGELYWALLENRTEQELEAIVTFCDFLEIQPISHGKWVTECGKLANEEELKNINRRIVELGEKYNKPVVATDDAHFLNPEDEICRRIYLHSQKFIATDRECPLYLRTTEEMLEEFSYLGQQKSYEVVVENTNLINNMIDYIKPFSQESYLPNLKNEATEAPAKEQIIQNKKFSVGNIVTVGNTTARKFVHKYFESRGFSITNEESQTLIENCVGVKQNTRQHHNLHIVIPDGYDIYDFTPLQHPANDPDSDIVITQFPASYFRKIELKIQRRMLYDHKNK